MAHMVMNYPRQHILSILCMTTEISVSGRALSAHPVMMVSGCCYGSIISQVDFIFTMCPILFVFLLYYFVGIT